MARIKITPYADGIYRSVTLSSNVTPPVPEFVESPFDGCLARVRSNLEPTPHEEILRKSISRTREKITELAHNMIPEWFGTLTFAPDKIDRYDMDACRNALTRWFKRIRFNVCPDIRYLVVPEQHKDGAWHFHVLLSCCDNLRFVDSGHMSGSHKIYNLKDWRFGFSNFTKVVDAQRTASYMVKYITKDLCVLSGRQRYLVSQNIPRYEPLVVVHNYMSAEDILERALNDDIVTTYERTYEMCFDEDGINESKNEIRIAYHMHKGDYDC